MKPDKRPHLLLAGFLIASLLLHLLVVVLLPREGVLPPPPEKPPVYVEIVPPAKKPPQPRELDLPEAKIPPLPRTTPAKRLGPEDQQVAKETAPEGKDPEDRPARKAAPPAANLPAPPKPAPSPPKPRPAPQVQSPPRPLGEGPTAAPATPAEPITPAPPTAKELPDLQALLKLPQETVARLEDQWRQKYRKDVEAGNAVWLDTEKDLLISFFKRFRDRIYNVWSYPPRSRERGEEGTCLLRITVLRDGSLADVQLLESSGYNRLDEEALSAVRKASPFGPLARSYEEESLTIFAFFRYSITGSYRIY